MSGFSGIVVGFCVALVVIGAVSQLLPEGSMKKSAKTLLGLVLVILLISIFKAGSMIDLGEAFSANTAPSQQANDYAISLSEISLKRMIMEILIEEGFSQPNIEVNMDNYDNNGISINKLIVKIKPEEDKQRAKDLIKEYLNVDAYVVSDGM